MLRAFTRSFTSTIPKKNFANGQLFGRVGNVDFKESANGVKYVRYSLAVNKFRKGEEALTDWYNITIFDEEELQKAEKVLRVGNKMIVDVTLRLDKFEDPETKKPQTRTSLIQKHAEIVQWGKKTDEDKAEATE